MWQILGALAAIIGLAGVMLLRSVLWPKPTIRERAEGEPLGVRISDAIEATRPRGPRRAAATTRSSTDEECADMTEIEHIPDTEHYWNGSEGRWAVCGEPMPDGGEAKPVCPKCIQLWVPVHERRAAPR